MEEMDSKILHMWEAKRSLQERWKGQKHNRRLRKRIVALERDIEDHANRLSQQQWAGISECPKLGIFSEASMIQKAQKQHKDKTCNGYYTATQAQRQSSYASCARHTWEMQQRHDSRSTKERIMSTSTPP
ncbi:hypothetical protein HPB52_019363 [Rhipicephalus sanguineus]|uniref:Uncharacterized protein n=1 Tax=Rhipicephalus sanguineus TaxID=34632 RepID=A0A9D4PIA4_RHISA|nr:hypothetical protein HPB52_019363 [Rhipicephalus sanguineus]